MLWIPQPLQKYCLGKTAEQCSTIDYCIRTTNKNISMCRSLGVDLRRLPAYPSDIRPRRVLSITYYELDPTKGFDTLPKGFGSLLKFFESAPKNTLDRLSTSARIKARIKLIRSSDDDQFELLEILVVPAS